MGCDVKWEMLRVVFMKEGEGLSLQHLVHDGHGHHSAPKHKM